MDTNGISLYNVGTSLDLDALTQGGPQNNNNHHDEDDTDDDGEEEEIQQRNAELRDLLTNAFDDLIEEDESDFEATGQHSRLHLEKSQEFQSDSSKQNMSQGQEYLGDSLHSPIHHRQNEDMPESLHQDTPADSESNMSFGTWSKNSHKKNCVRFSPLEESKTNPYRPSWNHSNEEEIEKHYLSSGLNSQAELEILYAARGTEISKLNSEIHHLHHKVALLEGEKTGMKMTLETSERMMQESRQDNLRLKEEIAALNQRVKDVIETNQNLISKLQAAENNAISLERQVLDLNLLQANHRDANRQDNLLSGIKARYDNDLRSLRDELNRLRTELDHKNENISTLERKLRDVTEMHERTLTERAANLQEFNRALDQQRILREQRDTLTSATLLDQLSRAQEEIERLKKERISQNLSDSMSQMRLGTNRDHSDVKQSDRIISSLEQRLQTSERNVKQLEEKIHQLQKEKEALNHELSTIAKTPLKPTDQDSKLSTELNNVKELYLAVCREKDSLEDQLQQMDSGRKELNEEKKHLLQELEEVNRNMEENLNRHKAMIEANWDAKMQTVVQEHVARARLEWLKEKTSGQVDDLVHVEKSLGELQCLREAMDALRHERDILQNELMKRQQQLKMERHLLREKFEVEKKNLIKTWQEKVAAASLVAADKSESQQPEKSLITATADAMARLRQQCEEEKLSIITSYEKQILELQSNSSTPLTSQMTSSARSAQSALDWKLDLSKIKICLRSNQQVPTDILPNLDSAIQKMETSRLYDQKVIQEQAEKYKHLKRRVRDYQKYVNDKLAKHKAERQRSEDYFRTVISDLLNRVNSELELLERDRANVNRATNVAPKVPMVRATAASKTPTASTPLGSQAGGLHSLPTSTFAQGIDDLQQQVNLYVRGLTNFTSTNK
ncbi:hypothetical protein GHT06_016875 [Daphnia sinensis]|uniref:Centrosomal protein of 152 kDa n=1 Tax=Daphnia sinensis TaxID=1820382 RepID=A0AAD5KQV5_9CRUS|nr:hypothetical protein GHT06_016875 [Daphnia sinensis]